MNAADAVRLVGAILEQLVRIAPDALDLLSPSERATVESIIAIGKRHMPAPGAAKAEVDRIFGDAPPAPFVEPDHSED